MKKLLILSLALFFSFSSLAAQVESKYITKSERIIDNLRSGNYEQIYSEFDAKMKSVFPVERIKSIWGNLKKQSGEFKEIVQRKQLKLEEHEAAVLTCKFEKLYLDFRIVFNSDYQVSGFFMSRNYSFVEFRPSEYVDTTKFEEREIEFGVEGWKLKGVLTLPKQAEDDEVPAVILVHGSGPNDKDESIGPNKPFRDLAWGLASKGIAAFRYDKRTLAHQLKAAALVDSLTLYEETVQDAVEAFKTLEELEVIDDDEIFILGHSLGGMAIPRIAEYISPEGYIVMAASGKPLHKNLLQQYRYVFELSEGLDDEEKAELDSLKTKLRRLERLKKNEKIPSELLPMNLPAKYWLDIRDYHPAKEAKEIDERMFVLHGSRDYQVHKNQFYNWQNTLRERDDEVKHKLYPKLNHLFMEGSGKCSPSEYYIENHVAEYVIDDIVKWILEGE